MLNWIRKVWKLFDYTLTGIDFVVLGAVLLMILIATLVWSVRWVGSLFEVSP